MKLRTIDTGYFYADGGAMFGAIPKSSWSRRYPCNDQNACVLAMRTLLIEEDDGRIILVDNGAGYKHLRTLSYYRFFDLQDLHKALSAMGIKPTDVTDMVFTHLHFDHCGYTTLHTDNDSGPLCLAFPNANHWVSHKQWENFRHPHPLEQGSYFPEDMLLVESAGRLRLIEEEEMQLTPHVRLRLFDGHTPGQIAVYCEKPERTYLFAGDVIPLAAHLSSAWISAYDNEPLRAYEAKTQMLDVAVKEKQALIYCHDAYTQCTTVKQINQFYAKDVSLTVD